MADWCHSPVSGDFGHGRRLEGVLPVRWFTRRAEMGRSPTVCRGKFLAGLSVGVLLPGHPGNGRPWPESAHGARDELPGLCTEHRRLRNRAPRPRARRVLLMSTLVALSTTRRSHRWRLVLLAATGFNKLCTSVLPPANSIYQILIL